MGGNGESKHLRKIATKLLGDLQSGEIAVPFEA